MRSCDLALQAERNELEGFRQETAGFSPIDVRSNSNSHVELSQHNWAENFMTKSVKSDFSFKNLLMEVDEPDYDDLNQVLVVDECQSGILKLGSYVTCSLLHELNIECDMSTSMLESIEMFTGRIKIIQKLHGKTKKPLQFFMYKLMIVDVSGLEDIEPSLQALHGVFSQTRVNLIQNNLVAE